jgi:vancomycin permeability regulator SanA
LCLMLLCLCLGVGCRSAPRQSPQQLVNVIDRFVFALTLLSAAILFPIAQMYCFGLTDYRRPADVAVVFGCLVNSDGRPSMALSDRVRTGVELYHSRLVSRLLFSGGPGEGATHETEAMRKLAVELGVPSENIDLDPDGLNTRLTVKNMVQRFQATQNVRVLVVSHFYHLPRIKLSFRRAGWDVMTVPARESREMVSLRMHLVREVAAIWSYYLGAV